MNTRTTLAPAYSARPVERSGISVCVYNMSDEMARVGMRSVMHGDGIGDTYAPHCWGETCTNDRGPVYGRNLTGYGWNLGAPCDGFPAPEPLPSNPIPQPVERFEAIPFRSELAAGTRVRHAGLDLLGTVVDPNAMHGLVSVRLDGSNDLLDDDRENWRIVTSGEPYPVEPVNAIDLAPVDFLEGDNRARGLRGFYQEPWNRKRYAMSERWSDAYEVSGPGVDALDGFNDRRLDHGATFAVVEGSVIHDYSSSLLDALDVALDLRSFDRPQPITVEAMAQEY